eukprot:2717315-Lingulodinium_polyedra.AAC.1
MSRQRPRGAGRLNDKPLPRAPCKSGRVMQPGLRNRNRPASAPTQPTTRHNLAPWPLTTPRRTEL